MKLRLIRLGALALSTAFLSLIGAAPATALQATTVCGQGSYVLMYARDIKNLSGNKVGSLSITKNTSSNVWCAVTIRTTGSTQPVEMRVWMRRELNDTNPVSDEGSYVTYAGPVYKTFVRDWTNNLIIEGDIANFGVQVWCDSDSCGPPI